MDYFFQHSFDVFYIALFILCLTFLIQLYYIYFIYGKLAIFKIEEHHQPSSIPPATIIICAYNEQENLKKFLPILLEQDYPQYEIIVVDDCSSDDTRWVLKEFCEKHQNIRVIEIKEHIQLKHTKKFALTIGIKGAKYNHLILTDADCAPSSDQWLKHMMSKYTEGKEIVLGYSPYFRYPGFLNRLIRFETTHTAMTYLSFALKKNTYMGVGRNLSYTKDLFFKGKGFNAHMHIKSGDDDLFINQNATSENVAVAVHPDSHVYSEPKRTWKSYYKQKARHSTASVAYKRKHKRTLGLQIASAVLFYLALAFTLLISPQSWPLLLSLYIVRLLSQIGVYYPIFKKLSVVDLLWWLPFLDIFYYFYISFNGLFNRSKKQTSW